MPSFGWILKRINIAAAQPRPCPPRPAPTPWAPASPKPAGLVGFRARGAWDFCWRMRCGMDGSWGSVQPSSSSPNLPDLAPVAFRGDYTYIEQQHTRWGASWVARVGTEWRWRLGCERPTTASCPCRRVDIFPFKPSSWTAYLFVHLQRTNIDEIGAFVLRKHERRDERGLWVSGLG